METDRADLAGEHRNHQSEYGRKQQQSHNGQADDAQSCLHGTLHQYVRNIVGVLLHRCVEFPDAALGDGRAFAYSQ